MTLKEYLKGLFFGVLYITPSYILWRENADDPLIRLFVFSSIVSAFLFPLSKYAVEKFALFFTRVDFWKRVFFIDTPAKSGLLVIYYGLCFAVAIPVGTAYLIYSIFKEKAT